MSSAPPHPVERFPSGSTRRDWLAWLGRVPLGVIGLASGCAWNCPPPVDCRDLSYLSAPNGFSYFFSPLWTERIPQRVLLATTHCLVQPLELQQQFVDQLSQALREAQLFEVVSDHQMHGCRCDLDAILHGQFEERHLLELTGRYNCDALLLARVNQFDFNWPMKTAVTLVMLDRAEAVALMGLDGAWDLGSPDLARFYTAFVADQNQLVPHQFQGVHRQSPRQFQRFVAWQIARLMLTHRI